MDLEWIRTRLVERDMTQTDLAAMIGLTPVQVSKMLNGTRQIKAQEWQKICEALGDPSMADYSTDPEKSKILAHFDAMTPDQREALIHFLEQLVKH